MFYQEKPEELTEDYWLRKAGREDFSSYLPESLIRSVYNARFKIGRLLFASVGCCIGLWSVTNDPQNPLAQDPHMKLIASSIFMYGTARAAAEAIYGRLKFQFWRQHCEILKEAGIVRRWLKDILRRDPLVRPLIIETARDIGLDSSEYELNNSKAVI